MSEAIDISIKATEKEKFSFMRNEDGIEKTVTGEQVENGWVITIDKRWEDKNPINNTSEWKYKTWKYISKHDPRKNLADDPADSSDETDLKHTLGSVLNTPGTLIVD